MMVRVEASERPPRHPNGWSSTLNRERLARREDAPIYTSRVNQRTNAPTPTNLPAMRLPSRTIFFSGRSAPVVRGILSGTLVWKVCGNAWAGNCEAAFFATQPCGTSMMIAVAFGARLVHSCLVKILILSRSQSCHPTLAIVANLQLEQFMKADTAMQ